MAKGLIRIKGGNFMEIVSDIPDFEIYLWDEDLAQIEPRYDEYKNEREELFTKLKTCKYNYLVTVKDAFTRDTQVAPNEYIYKYLKEEDIDDTLSWGELASSEVVVGVFKGVNEKEAIVEAAMSFSIDKSALNAYPLA